MYIFKALLVLVRGCACLMAEQSTRRELRRTQKCWALLPHLRPHATPFLPGPPHVARVTQPHPRGRCRGRRRGERGWFHVRALLRVIPGVRCLRDQQRADRREECVSAEAWRHCHLFVQKTSVSAHKEYIPRAMCVIGRV